MTRRTYTLAELARALSFIDAQQRETWVQMAMALHSEYPGSDGRDAFMQWSASAPNYDAKAARDTWKSIKPGNVRIGTLIAAAKAAGWVPDAPDAAPVLTAQEQAVKRQAAEQQQQRQQAAQAASHAKAAQTARQSLQDAQATGASEYLTRKGIGPHGVKFAAGGALLVPMRDAAGAVWNVQTIRPDGQKRFLAGGRKSGLWHWTVEPEPASAGPLLIAEGYATAASLTEATGYPCAVAFDAGNLGKVAQSIRALHPGAVLALCADDDSGGHASSGKNPGLDAGRAAAKAVKAALAIPAHLPDGGSDFNDLAQSSGPAAVQACISAALAARADACIPATKSNEHANDTPQAGSEDAPPEDDFMVNEGYLWAATVNRGEGSKLRRIWRKLCRPLQVLSRVRDTEGNGWGRLLEFADPRGTVRRMVLPDAKLTAERAEWPALLADRGFDPPMDAAGKRALAQYIRTRPASVFAKTVQRIGWHDEGVFILGDGAAIGEAAEPYLYQREGADSGFKERGTLDEWRQSTGALCVGNSRLVFAVSCAFAGVLLEPYQTIPGAGFHLYGESGKGKSTCLLAAASVWGGERAMLPWRATDSALEWIAAAHCDTFLAMDELKQIEPGALAQAVYMMGNGSGKARSNQGGANRPQHTWRLWWLSSGEMRTEDRIKEAIQKTRFYAGQEVRMPDIPADAGAGLGAFEQLHGHPNGGDFAKAVNLAIHQAHGSAGPAFVRWVVANRVDLPALLRRWVADLVQRMTPKGAADGVYRAAERFALAACAGELATQAGITGWPPGEAEQAAAKCMAAWIEARGGIESGEDGQARRQVQNLMRLHQKSRFIALDRITDTHAPNVANVLGYSRFVGSVSGKPIERENPYARESAAIDGMPASDDAEDVEIQFIIPPDAWREICAGYNPEKVRRLLADLGLLDTDKNHLTKNMRLPGQGGKQTRCTVVRGAILTADL
jgi:putative DNA primase/helicase